MARPRYDAYLDMCLTIRSISRYIQYMLFFINQSIKSSFVKRAGAHPQNAPCRRRSHALKKAPVRQGRLLSTVFHRWSPRQSILSAGVIRYFHPPIFSPRGENIVRYFHPGVKISLRYLHPPYDIFTPLPIKAIYDRHIIYNCWGAFSPYV